MYYFTSDLHIGHDKEFIWGSRGFSSLEEHDTEMMGLSTEGYSRTPRVI